MLLWKITDQGQIGVLISLDVRKLHLKMLVYHIALVEQRRTFDTTGSDRTILEITVAIWSSSCDSWTLADPHIIPLIHVRIFCCQMPVYIVVVMGIQRLIHWFLCDLIFTSTGTAKSWTSREILVMINSFPFLDEPVSSRNARSISCCDSVI